MADVFISYHEQSAGELAEQIADALEDAGISCWCARRDMLFGGNFAREIPSQIHACRLFLLILNENVYHSEHIENEVGIAFSRLNKKEDIRILPLEVGEFTRKDWVEYYLIHAQSVKFPAQPDEQRIQHLIKRIARNLNQKTQSTPQPTPQLNPKSASQSTKIIKRGQCGENVTYALDENGVLTISGSGAMRDFKWNKEEQTRDTPWWSERKTLSLVKIQDNVTTIGAGAFNGCVNLTSISITDSLTMIGRWAFHGCANLTSIHIPERVITIGEWAFNDCAKLTEVKIPDGVTSVGYCAFRGCSALTSINIPNSMTTIRHSVFWGCSGLTSVCIPDNVTSIGDCAFYDCSGLINVSLSESVTTIGEAAFNGCTELTSVNIPNNVITIGDGAFFWCVALTKVTIPDSVTEIGKEAFKNCPLTSVSVPAKAEIADDAFDATVRVTRRV